MYTLICQIYEERAMIALKISITKSSGLLNQAVQIKSLERFLIGNLLEKSAVLLK